MSADSSDSASASPDAASSSTGWMRWVLYGVGGLVALVLGVAVLLPQFFPEERLKAFVIPPMEETLQRDVTIDGIGLQVLPFPAVRVTDFSIANAEGFSTQPALSGEAFNVEIALFPLFSGTIEPTAVEFIRPVVRYEVASDGATNFDTLGGAADTTAAESSGGAPAIGVSNVRMTEARILYTDASTGQSAEVVFDAQLSALPDGDTLNTTGEIRASTLQAVLPPADTAPSGTPADTLALRDATLAFDLGADLNAGRLDLRDLSLSTAPLSLTTSGTVTDLNTRPSLDLNVKTGETDLSQLAGFLPPGTLQDVAPRGTVTLDVSISGLAPDSTGSLDDLAVDGSGRLGGIGVDYQGSTLLSDLGAQVALSLEALTLDGIDGKLLGKPLKGRISITDLMNEPMLDGRLSGSADLAELTAMAASGGESGDGAASEEVAGTAEYDVQFSGPATDPDGIRVRGPITMQNVRYVTASLREPLSIPEATMEFTGTGFRMNRFTMKTGPYSMALQATLSNLLPASRAFDETNPALAVSFTLTSDRLDMVEMFPEEADTTVTYSQLFAAQLAGTKVNGRPANDVAREVYGGIEVPAFDIDGRVEIATLLNPPQRYDNLAMDVTSRDRRLTVDNLSGQTYGGELSGSVTIDQSDTASALAPRYESTSVAMASSGAGIAPRRLQDAPNGAVAYDIQLTGARAGAFLNDWTTLGRFVEGTMDFNLAGDSPLTDGLLPLAEALRAQGRSIVADGGFAPSFSLPNAIVSKLGVDKSRFADFRTLGGPFTIEDGALQVSDWSFANRFVTGRLDGALGLGGTIDAAFVADVPVSSLEGSGLVNASGLSRVLKALSGSDETISIRMGLDGTVSSPTVGVDQGAIQEALKKLAPSPGDAVRGIFKRDGGGR